MHQHRIFLTSVFFVLGFTLVFSVLGVILQVFLTTATYTTQVWLSRIGGIIIILFGLYLMGLFQYAWLAKERKLKLPPMQGYTASFIFGAAFAVGWTPCVGPILGAILTLAVIEPAQSFLLLVVYSLGMGVPFLLVGAFTQKAQGLLLRYAPVLVWIRIVFGLVLVFLGILALTMQMSTVAYFGNFTHILAELEFLLPFDGSLNFFLAFIAGLLSFLSPCVAPLIPAYLMYLTGTAMPEKKVVKK